jgi:hypothetical protein
MTKDLNILVEKARSISMTETDKEKQRRSFAYGSAKIENDDITREIIDEAAARVGKPKQDDE